MNRKMRGSVGQQRGILLRGLSLGGKVAARFSGANHKVCVP